MVRHINKKGRYVKRTVLIYTEGKRDKVLATLIKEYFSREEIFGISIMQGSGGTPYEIVVEAERNMLGKDRVMVLVDNDKTKLQMDKARQEASRSGIELVESSPCIEAVLLSVLESGEIFSSKSSGFCKKKLEKYYLKSSKSNLEDFRRIFPKRVINAACGSNEILKKIRNLMEESNYQ